MNASPRNPWHFSIFFSRIREKSEFIFPEKSFFVFSFDWLTVLLTENVKNLGTLTCCVNFTYKRNNRGNCSKRTKVTKIISLKAKFNFINLLRKLLIHYKIFLIFKIFYMYFTCSWTFNQRIFVVIFWLGYFGHKILYKSGMIHLIAKKTSKQIIFIIKTKCQNMTKT